MLRTVILSTETNHHLYYVWQLLELCTVEAVILESNSLSPKFETNHKFENEREEYEKFQVLKDGPKKFENLLPVHAFSSINDPACIQKIEELKPDMVIIFGTGKVCPYIISIPHKACLNLHGGAPEYYRGLDSHLWAIYHNDFKNLVTTMHFVEPVLDCGQIIFQEQLRLSKESTLMKLRIINTIACIRMSALALNSMDQNSFLPCRSQLRKGRYYSFMPTDLKDVCLKKFNHHIQSLE